MSKQEPGRQAQTLSPKKKKTGLDKHNILYDYQEYTMVLVSQKLSFLEFKKIYIFLLIYQEKKVL